MTLRNLILIVFLALFFVWYVANWAYKTQYQEPRKRLGDEIAKLTQEIENGQRYVETWGNFCNQYQGLYARSLPAIPNDARSLYSGWFMELLQHSGLEIVSDVAISNPNLFSPLGYNYRVTVQCTGSLSQFSNFLFEFYYAGFLHRLSSVTLTPVEGNREKLTFSMVVNVLVLDSRFRGTYTYQYLPSQFTWQRLLSNDLATYQVIEDRNLLQTARGGIDKADYTFLTTIIVNSNGPSEAWFLDRTNDVVIKAKVGDPIQAGSFTGKIVEILDEDIVLERGGVRWLLTAGENLGQSFALPLETSEPAK